MATASKLVSSHVVLWGFTRQEGQRWFRQHFQNGISRGGEGGAGLQFGLALESRSSAECNSDSV